MSALVSSVIFVSLFLACAADGLKKPQAVDDAVVAVDSLLRTGFDAADSVDGIIAVEPKGIVDHLVPFNLGKPYFPWFQSNQNLLCPNASDTTATYVPLYIGGSQVGTATFTADPTSCKITSRVCGEKQEVDVQGTTVEQCPAWLAERKITLAITDMYFTSPVNSQTITSGTAMVVEVYYLRICGTFQLSFGKGFLFQFPKCCLTDVDVIDSSIKQTATALDLEASGTNICSGCFSNPVDTSNCDLACGQVLSAIQNAALSIGQQFDDAVFTPMLPECQSRAALWS